MRKINIYIETDCRMQSRTPRKYGYVLEGTYKGEPYTKECFGFIDGTYHQTILNAVAEALGRLNIKAEVTVYTDDAHVASRLKKWKETQNARFMDAKGTEIRNAAEWKRICSEATNKNLELQTKYGKHEYSSWIQEEMKKQVIE